MFVVVALNVVEVAAAATVTEAGTVSVVFVLVSVTFAPPAGAAPESVTVHVLEAFCPSVLGLQPSEETVTAAGAINVIELVLDTLPRVAVMTAVWLDDTALAVAVKVAVVAPAATVTEAGTASDGLSPPNHDDAMSVAES